LLLLLEGEKRGDPCPSPLLLLLLEEAQAVDGVRDGRLLPPVVVRQQVAAGLLISVWFVFERW
jgi:hypothetical protein